MKHLFLAVLLYTTGSFLMLAGAQGVKQFWGTTLYGGKDGVGTIFSMKADGTGFQKKHDFTSKSPGANSWYTELEVHNGLLYGVTGFGGAYNEGSLFAWDPSSNQFTRKYDFSHTTGTGFGVLAIVDNKVYGITQRGGVNKKGIIYEFDLATGSFSVKVEFDNASGYNPVGGLIELSGKLYGLTKYGGSNNSGTLYEYNISGNSFSKKVDLTISPGEGNVLATNGTNVYGLLRSSSQIFEFNPSTGVYTVKYTIQVDAGGSNPEPNGGLTFYGGKFYGTTQNGGIANNGVVFEWDPATNIYSRKKELANKVSNYAGGGHRVKILNNKLHGVMRTGGGNGAGTIFQLDISTSAYNEVSSFSAVTGSPANSLTAFNDKLYGSALNNGNLFVEALYECDPIVGSLTKKINFLEGEGTYPLKILHSNAKLYGSTYFGGTANQGSFFEFDKTSNTKTKRYDLSWPEGSAYPTLFFTAIDVNNKITGFSQIGGVNDGGFIFEWDAATNTYINKYNFIPAAGANPVTLLYDGSKYFGLAQNGGINNSGVFFEYDKATNNYIKRYDFPAGTLIPYSSTLIKTGTKIYGTTNGGGANNRGIIFEYDIPTNTFLKKYDFLNSSGMEHTLVEAAGKFIVIDGNDSPNGGFIWEWNSVSNTLIKKYDFTPADQGRAAGYLSVSGSKIYGATIYVYPGDYGVIFEYDVLTGIYERKQVFNGLNGLNAVSMLLTSASIASIPLNSCTSFPSITIDNSNNNQWVPITNEFGDVVAELKANGNNLGTVSTQLFINGGPVREDANKKLYLNRSFSITPQFQPTSPVDIRLYITDEEFNSLKTATNSLGQPSGINTINDLSIFKNADACNNQIIASTTQVNSANAVYDGGGYVITGSISSFSSFYFSRSSSTLPLRFLSMNVQAMNSEVLISWATADELNTEDFVVERSYDGRTFNSAGTVVAKGSAGSNNYRFVDKESVFSGKAIAYYRIKQRDNDGRFSYSSIGSVVFKTVSDVIEWPNPAKNGLNLLITTGKKEKFFVRIADLTGRILTEDEFIADKGSLQKYYSLAAFKNGIYVVEIRSESIHKNIRVVKQ